MSHAARITLAAAAAIAATIAARAQAPAAAPPAAAPSALKFEAQEIQREFGVGYAVAIGDVNADKRPDVIAISGTQLVWFENPGRGPASGASAGAGAASATPAAWTPHVVLDNQTPKDNVALAPHDIDGDGRLDFAVGAAWKPSDTNNGGTLHWVRQPAPGASAGSAAGAGPGSAAAGGAAPAAAGTVGPAAASAWTLMDIASEPTLHRIRWGNVDGRGGPELIVGPLHGRGTSPPEWNGQGARLLVFHVPANPARDKWEVEVADDSFHILHNFAVVRFDGDTRDDLLTASREGVQLLKRSDDGKWTRTKIAEGAPGEIKLGRVGGRRILATIEPWHGQSVVLYLEPDGAAAAKPGDAPALWTRRVIDDTFAGGHAIGWGDFDGDGDDELAAGWRDKEGGLVIYDLDREGAVREKSTVDAGGMAAEDLTVADLDADGRPEVIASGRRTANVKIYWNRSALKPGAKPRPAR